MVKKHHIPFIIRFFDQSFPSFVIGKNPKSQKKPWLSRSVPLVYQPMGLAPGFRRGPKELVQGSGPANGWVTPSLRGKEPTDSWRKCCFVSLGTGREYIDDLIFYRNICYAMSLMLLVFQSSRHF